MISVWWWQTIASPTHFWSLSWLLILPHFWLWKNNLRAMITYKSFTILPYFCYPRLQKNNGQWKTVVLFWIYWYVLFCPVRASFYALRFYKAYYAPIDIVLLSFCHWVLNPRPLYRLVTFTYSTPYMIPLACDKYTSFFERLQSTVGLLFRGHWIFNLFR